MRRCRRSHQGFFRMLVVVSGLSVMILSLSCKGTPTITLEQAGSKWYAGIGHTVYARVTDAAAGAEILLTHGVTGQEAFEPIEMSRLSEPTLNASSSYYYAEIPPAHVRHGLYLEVSTPDELGEAVTARTQPVIRFFPFEDADPALNIEEFGADVSRVARIPTVFSGPTSGQPTDFGYSFPGALWVPVELSGFAEYMLLAELSERGNRQSTYEGVLTHLFVQDGLGDWTLGHRMSDQDILDLIQSTAEASGLVFGQWDVLTESFGAARRLTRVEMDAWLEFLGSELRFTRSQAKWARIYESFGTVGTILESVDLAGDGLRAVFLMQLMNDAALDRLELFERTYMTRPDIDPVLVDAVDAVNDHLESFDGELIRAIQEITDPMEWGPTAVWALLSRMRGTGALEFALDGSAAVQLFQDAVVEKLGLLRRLVVAATLEKTITDLPTAEPILGRDALELAQMKFYLGYYYSSLFLSIRGEVAPELLDRATEAPAADPLDTALDAFSALLPKSMLETAYAHGSGEKHFLIAGAGTPFVDLLSVTVFIDLDDYFAVTEEGKDGWVTTLLTVSVSAGVSLLPFDIGIWKLNLADAPGGCPDPQIEASAELANLNLAAVYKVTGAQAGPDGHEIWHVDTDTAVANVSFALAAMTTASLNMEVRREVFDQALLQALPGVGQAITADVFANAILDAITSLPSVTLPAMPIWEVFDQALLQALPGVGQAITAVVFANAILDAITSLPSVSLPSMPIRAATCADSAVGDQVEDSSDRLEHVNTYSVARHAEYTDLLAFTSPMPEGSLTLQEAAELGYIQLESKGGYSGDAVTLIATGANEDDVTVVSRPGDVLLVKGEQGLKQSLVISNYDTTLIRGDTLPGTVLKRGIYTFCINANASGLHEGDRFDVTLNLENWPYESAQQLLMLLTAIDQAARHEDSSAQQAVWAITNNASSGSESQTRLLLLQAGILSGSSLGVFPALLTNPAAGSPDTTFVMPPELRGCSLFVVTLICGLLVLLLTLAGAIVVARCRS